MFSDFIASFQGEETDRSDDKEVAGEGRAGSKFSFAAVASSVISTVKGDVDDIVTSLRTTNWTNELKNFGKAVQDETAEAMKSIEGLPEKAGNVIPGMNSVRQHLGTGIQKLAVGTKELFDQAVGTIESELTVNQRSPASKPATSRRSFEAELMDLQRDSGTYCDEPEDAANFQKWKTSFTLAEKQQAIEELLAGNTFVTELHKRIVPVVIDYDTFWTRYFYRLHKLRESYDQSLPIAERRLRMHEEEELELQWDDDDVPTAHQKDEKPAKETVVKSFPESADESAKRPTSSEKESSEWSIVDSVPTEPVPSDTAKVTEPAKQNKDDEEEEVDEDWGEWD